MGQSNEFTVGGEESAEVEIRRLSMKASTSPIRLGFAAAGLLIFGIMSLVPLIDTFPTSLWLIAAVPIIVGLFVQLFAHKPFWLQLYLVFLFLLNSIVFSLILWFALVLGSPDSGQLIPSLLVVLLGAGGIYSGYQLNKSFHQQLKTTRSAEEDPSAHTKSVPYVVIAGRRLSSTTIERVALRIRALTPLLIAFGLNSAQMLSRQEVFWIFGGIGLVFVVMFTMGIGAVWYRLHWR